MICKGFYKASLLLAVVASGTVCGAGHKSDAGDEKNVCKQDQKQSSNKKVETGEQSHREKMIQQLRADQEKLTKLLAAVGSNKKGVKAEEKVEQTKPLPFVLVGVQCGGSKINNFLDLESKISYAIKMCKNPGDSFRAPYLYPPQEQLVCTVMYSIDPFADATRLLISKNCYKVYATINPLPDEIKTLQYHSRDDSGAGRYDIAKCISVCDLKYDEATNSFEKVEVNAHAKGGLYGSHEYAQHVESCEYGLHAKGDQYSSSTRDCRHGQFAREVFADAVRKHLNSNKTKFKGYNTDNLNDVNK